VNLHSDDDLIVIRQEQLLLREAKQENGGDMYIFRKKRKRVLLEQHCKGLWMRALGGISDRNKKERGRRRAKSL